MNGVPDFKVIDPEAVIRCIYDRLCGLCGHRIMGRLHFIGGEASMRSKLFNDPAMHKACALYAYEVCPFLNGSLTLMKPENRTEILVSNITSPIRPKRYGLYKTRSCWLGNYEGEKVIVAEPGGSIRWLNNEKVT